jgi:hypothetical protein
LLLHCFGFSHFKVVHETADPFEMIEASDGGDELRTRLAHPQPHPALVVASLDGQMTSTPRVAKTLRKARTEPISIPVRRKMQAAKTRRLVKARTTGPITSRAIGHRLMFEKGNFWKVRMQSWNITPASPAETKWTRTEYDGEANKAALKILRELSAEYGRSHREAALPILDTWSGPPDTLPR